MQLGIYLVFRAIPFIALGFMHWSFPDLLQTRRPTITFQTIILKVTLNKTLNHPCGGKGILLQFNITIH